MHAMGVNQIMGVHVILFLIQKLFPINILTTCIIENNSLSAEISLLTSAKIICMSLSVYLNSQIIEKNIYSCIPLCTCKFATNLVLENFP